MSLQRPIKTQTDQPREQVSTEKADMEMAAPSVGVSSYNYSIL